MKRFNSKNRLRKYSIKIEKKQETTPVQETDFTGILTTDLEHIRREIGHNTNVNIREFKLGYTEIRAAIIFISGLSDKELIDTYILKCLMLNFPEEYSREHHSMKSSALREFIKTHVLSISELTEVLTLNKLITGVLKGKTALLIDGSPISFILGTIKEKQRQIEEPSSEVLVRGPRVGFTESLMDNMALLRQHGVNQNLTLISFQVGNQVQKELVVAYMKNIANEELVEEVKRRIQTIDIDDALESGYIEQLIEDKYLSPFPQVESTERLDRVVSALIEGRVAILLDGTPFVLIVPVTFSMMLQSPEDYYRRWIPGTLFRMLRFLAAGISLLAPSLYIAFISFHQGLIPTKLAISIAESRQGVPYPSFIEALIMEFSIEILREAGLRLPKPVGQAVGIVGGLVIGEAAVQAGIVSPIMVIVVSITAISSFAIPQYNAGVTLRFLRFVNMFFAAMLGLYGVILFFLLLCSHMVKLKSFGVPYVSPAAPYRLSDWKDFIIRMPLSMMKRRPKMLQPKDPIRKG